MITPDGRSLVVGETVGQRLTAFEHCDDGRLTGRREWARFGDLPDTDVVAEAITQAVLAPDGMCLDAEGAVWVADALGHRVVRVREGSDIVEEIVTGDVGVFACMLGGEDGRTLYLCTAPSFVEHERRGTREAMLLAGRVDVPHAGLP